MIGRALADGAACGDNPPVRRDPDTIIDVAPAGFDLERFLPYLIVRAALRLGTASDALFTRRYGLTRRMWRVLGSLATRDGQGVTALAQRTATEISTLSRLIDAMEDQGLVLRRRERPRTRSVQIHITNAGRELFLHTLPGTIKTFEILTADMSAREIATLTRGLHKIYSRMDEVETYIASLIAEGGGASYPPVIDGAWSLIDGDAAITPPDRRTVRRPSAAAPTAPAPATSGTSRPASSGSPRARKARSPLP